MAFSHAAQIISNHMIGALVRMATMYHEIFNNEWFGTFAP